MSISSRAYYVPCFQCKTKPATIKCFTCRLHQGSEPERLCYRCDGQIHTSDKASHNKEFIPFVEMKSNKAKDVPSGFSNSSMRFFENNDRKPEINNTKKEILQRINDINEGISGNVINNTYRTEYIQPRSFEPDNKEDYNREKTKKAQNVARREAETAEKLQETIAQTPKLKSEENRQEKETQKEIELLMQELERQRQILNEKRKTHEETGKKADLAIQEQRKKNSELSEEIEQINTEYESQIAILKSSLHELRNQYELKLKEFEKMLKSSGDTIKGLQAAIKESHKNDDGIETEEFKGLKKDLMAVNEGISQCERNLSENKNKFESSNANYQTKMAEKDKIIDELSAINQLRQNEIQKLDELVKNFEELFGHYQEEKEQLTSENTKINEELKKFNDLLQRIDPDEEEGEEHQSDDEAEEVQEGNEEQNDDGGVAKQAD